MDFHFLIATERSGSNLITKMMDAHPNICGPAPLHILRVIGMEIHKYGDLRQEKAWEKFVSDMLALANSEFAKWNKNFTRAELEGMAEPGDVPTFCRKIYEAEAAASGKSILFVKELWTHRYLSFLQWCFPEAKYIYLVRDPRDMALSWRNNEVHMGGVVAGARQWMQDQSQTLPNFSALEGAGKGHLVRYEDLVSKSELELTKICKFLGVDYSALMLEFHKKKLTKENAKKNPLWKNLATEVISDNFHKYRTELNDREIAIIEYSCWRVMQFFGYKAESKMPLLKSLRPKDANELHKEEVSKYPAKPQQRIHDQIQKQRRAAMKIHRAFAS